MTDQVEIRVGDWVKVSRIVKPFQVRRVGRDVVLGDEDVARRDECYHCAPDPLPEELPAGTEWAVKGSVGWVVVTMLRRDGHDIPRWEGISATKSEGVAAKTRAFPDEISWPSYWAALHAEQDHCFHDWNPSSEICKRCGLRLEHLRLNSLGDPHALTGDSPTRHERGESDVTRERAAGDPGDRVARTVKDSGTAEETTSVGAGRDGGCQERQRPWPVCHSGFPPAVPSGFDLTQPSAEARRVRCCECLQPFHPGRPRADLSSEPPVCGDCLTQIDHGRARLGIDDLPLDARIAEAQAARKRKIDQLRAELDRKSAKHPWDKSGEWPWEG